MWRLIGLFLTLLLGACAAQNAYVQHSSDVAATDTAGTDPATGGTTSAGVATYALHVGDKVRINTFNEPTLSGEFVVSSTGSVSLPLIGDVKAEGVSAAQLDSAIEARLADGYLREPRVSVEVLTYRPFYVLGEVNHAGEYAYSDGMTVLQAIAAAQGFTYRADKRRVFIKRAGQDAETKVEITSTLTVGPGDTVRVGERYF